MKASIILVVLMLGIIVSNLLEERIANRSNVTVSSIFEDRLQPSTDLYEMRTLNQQRLFILEEYLHAHKSEDKQRLKNKMELSINKFDGLLTKYKATFLVKAEKDVLTDLNQSLAAFNSIFPQFYLVSTSNDKAIAAAKVSISQINENLGKLNRLQSEIGKQLLEDYKQDTFYSTFLNTFQILLAILIGVIILKMVATSSLLNKFDRKVNLN